MILKACTVFILYLCFKQDQEKGKNTSAVMKAAICASEKKVLTPLFRSEIEILLDPMFSNGRVHSVNFGGGSSGQLAGQTLG